MRRRARAPHVIDSSFHVCCRVCARLTDPASLRCNDQVLAAEQQEEEAAVVSHADGSERALAERCGTIHCAVLIFLFICLLLLCPCNIHLILSNVVTDQLRRLSLEDGARRTGTLAVLPVNLSRDGFCQRCCAPALHVVSWVYIPLQHWPIFVSSPTFFCVAQFPRPDLASLVRNGMPPLRQTTAGTPSNTTPSSRAPFTRPTKWEVSTVGLATNDVVFDDVDPNMASGLLSALQVGRSQHQRAELQFGEEAALTHSVVRLLLNDTMVAIGARNFTVGGSTTARSRNTVTLTVDTWGLVDATIFTDTNDVVAVVEVKLPGSLNNRNGFMSTNTACQVYNYLSWLAIDLGVGHPMALLQTGDKAALCFRDVDKAYAEEVIAMDLARRKELWPARLVSPAAAAGTTPTSAAAAAAAEVRTPRRQRENDSGDTESPEPRTPIAPRTGTARLPHYSSHIVGGSDSNGGHGGGQKERPTTSELASASGGSEGSAHFVVGSGGGCDGGVAAASASPGSNDATQKLYRTAIYQVCDLYGPGADATADEAARRHARLVDPADGAERFRNYAALVSAALATGQKLQPQPLRFDGESQQLRVATYQPNAKHPVFNNMEWTLQFGRPHAGFRNYSVLRQLGCGADGVVHLVAGHAQSGVTVSVCAAKRFHDGGEAKATAERECERAANISKGVLDATYFSVRQVGTHTAFFMPYFEPVPADERLGVLDSNEFGALMDRIAEAGLQPCFADNEVHWRHVGMFRNEDGKQLTMIDLGRFDELPKPVQRASKAAKQAWAKNVEDWQGRMRDILRKRACGSTGSDEEVLRASPAK